MHSLCDAECIDCPFGFNLLLAVWRYSVCFVRSKTDGAESRMVWCISLSLFYCLTTSFYTIFHREQPPALMPSSVDSVLSLLSSFSLSLFVNFPDFVDIVVGLCDSLCLRWTSAFEWMGVIQCAVCVLPVVLKDVLILLKEHPGPSISAQELSNSQLTRRVEASCNLLYHNVRCGDCTLPFSCRVRIAILIMIMFLLEILQICP